ncbi:MAG: hypothetical protein O7G85_09985 [Planctomycetota bacterium]|nr:hypothetical protein [Planctomycetota bacterium]
MTDEARRRFKITLLWRIALVGYVILLFIATHWPSLKLGEDGPSDKSIHLYVFGVIPILLWQTRWISRLGVMYLITLLWCVFDEWTQGIPILDRDMTWQDLASNILGVTVATTWIWAMRPLGGPGNRLRLARYRYVVEEIFSSLKAWFIFVGLFLACTIPIVLLWPVLKPVGMQGPLAFAVVIWGMASGVVWSNVWRVHSASAVTRKECFACGSSCEGHAFDDLGRSACNACGWGVHTGQWLEHTRPNMSSLLKFSIVPAVIGIALVVLAFLALGLVATLYDWLLSNGILADHLPRAVRIMGQERALMQAVDFTAVFIVFAIITSLFRRRLARYYDQPHICLKCGHDLRGTPTDDGLGRCGECGFLFSRAPELTGVEQVSQ